MRVIYIEVCYRGKKEYGFKGVGIEFYGWILGKKVVLWRGKVWLWRIKGSICFSLELSF